MYTCTCTCTMYMYMYLWTVCLLCQPLVVVEARTCRYRITLPNGKGYRLRKAVQEGERGERRREGEREGRRKGKGKVVNIQYMYCALGDCLTSRLRGRLRPRELWFLIYSCTCEWFKLKWNVMSVHLT